jgi:hypothetical protein
MTRALILALALTLGGCSAQHVIGAAYIYARYAPRTEVEHHCRPPRIERRGICAMPSAFPDTKTKE